MTAINMFVIFAVAACARSTSVGPAPAPILPPGTPENDTAPVTLPTVTSSTTVAQGGSEGDNLTIGLESVISGLDRPVFITHANDGSGRLFIVEQGGLIRVFQNGRLVEPPYLDIRDRVNDGASERGLLGLAFTPDFAQSGHLFVNYSDQNGATTITRFTAADAGAATVDPESAVEILSIDQPASNHNGGMLAFGPDGYLYIGTGDGGAANDKFGNGQNPSTLLGKMLRIDVSGIDAREASDQPYAIPADNPWVAVDWQGADVRDEIWAVGLRNPWRYSFDRNTGDLWIGDVGQGKYEEIDMIAAGAVGPLNFGWPIMEGKQCFPDDVDCDQTGLVSPLLDYTHGGNCSITGGYVYRGEEFPALDGVYFYGDYCSGKIWMLTPDDTGGWRNQLALSTDLRISTFGEDEQGELYVADHGKGDVYRVVVE